MDKNNKDDFDGDFLHQNHPYYSYSSMPTHPHQIMPTHIYKNMLLHIYLIITPHQVFLCPCFNSTPMYAPYAVTHYPHIPYLGYLHTLSIILTSYVLPPHLKKCELIHM